MAGVQQRLHPMNHERQNIMTGEPVPFIDYWNAVNAALLRFFGIDTGDTGLIADRIAEAQEEG
jgi:hypothetical protein